MKKTRMVVIPLNTVWRIFENKCGVCIYYAHGQAVCAVRICVYDVCSRATNSA